MGTSVGKAYKRGGHTGLEALARLVIEGVLNCSPLCQPLSPAPHPTYSQSTLQTADLPSSNNHQRQSS